MKGGFDGANGVNGRGGGFGVAGGFGLGGLVVEGGGGAVGDEAVGVAVSVGLNGDSYYFPDSIIDGENHNLAEGVVDGFIVGLLRHGLTASETHCKQGKRRYEGSRDCSPLPRGTADAVCYLIDFSVGFIAF